MGRPPEIRDIKGIYFRIWRGLAMGEYSREIRHCLVLLFTPQSRGVVEHSRASPPCLSRGASLQIFNSAYVYLQPHLLLMPPKKKTKILSRAAPTDADSPLPEIVTFDGWTDEQETTLFKAISVYRLKPAGELHQATVPNQQKPNVCNRHAQALPNNRHL